MDLQGGAVADRVRPLDFPALAGLAGLGIIVVLSPREAHEAGYRGQACVRGLALVRHFGPLQGDYGRDPARMAAGCDLSVEVQRFLARPGLR